MTSEIPVALLKIPLIRGLQHVSFSNLTLAIVIIGIYGFYAVHQHGGTSIPAFEMKDMKNAKKRWMHDSLNLLSEGYRKHSRKAFRVWSTEGEQVILPPNLIDEVKMLPNDTFDTSLPEFLQFPHTGFGGPGNGRFGTHIIKHDLNKHMPKVFPGMVEEVNHALPLEFPSCDQWTPIVVSSRVMRVVCRTAGRVFVGAQLNRTPEWIKLNCEYTMNAFGSAIKLKEWHPRVRFIVRYLSPEVRHMQKQHDKATKLVEYVIKEREEAEKSKDYQKPDDAIEWTRDTLPAGEKTNYRVQAILQLFYGAVSIQTTTQMVTCCVYNLAAYQEYLPILRKEAQDVLREAGGEWTLDSMNSLKKLDSFIKESQRYHGSVIGTVQRIVNKPITLSDGTYLKKGTNTLAPTMAVLVDPAFYPDPEKFDGWRFYNLRQKSAEEANKHQFVSTSNSQLSFGSGRHACPGRWLASHEIKLIIASLILRYDMKLKDGEDRPKNLLFQLQYRPDPAAEILFRNVKVEA